jgi:hypothetical protein
MPSLTPPTFTRPSGLVFPAYPQQFMPIVFILYSGLNLIDLATGEIPIIVPFGIPLIGLVRPDHLSIHRRARGAIMHAARGAVLDDFGEGAPQLLMQGNTGWRGSLISGMTGFKLIELLMIEYERRRLTRTQQGRDPNDVKLWYFDVLNLEAFEIYLHESTFEKDRTRPLLYFYRIRATVVKDLLFKDPDDSFFEGFGDGSSAAMASVFP